MQPMTKNAVQKVRNLELTLMKQPQIDIETHHLIHAGMYTRTVMVPKGVLITGAQIKIDTTVIINGDVSVYSGGESMNIQGYAVIQGLAGRKQAFLAHKDTYISMMFSTDVTTVEDAEEQFTDEVDLLQSRGGS